MCAVATEDILPPLYNRVGFVFYILTIALTLPSFFESIITQILTSSPYHSDPAKVLDHVIQAESLHNKSTRRLILQAAFWFLCLY